MNRILVALSWFPVTLSVIALSFLLLRLNFKILAKNKITSGVMGEQSDAILPTSKLSQSTIPGDDFRKAVLHRFFTGYSSPLIDHLDTLLHEADTYAIDYALIPAIAMQESNGCKLTPSESYNCWGFGIYGKTVTRFLSYDEAIAQVAKTIKETYIKKGLTNPTLLEDRWAPQSRGLWSYSVNFFISKIRELERNLP